MVICRQCDVIVSKLTTNYYFWHKILQSSFLQKENLGINFLNVVGARKYRKHFNEKLVLVFVHFVQVMKKLFSIYHFIFIIQTINGIQFPLGYEWKYCINNKS